MPNGNYNLKWQRAATNRRDLAKKLGLPVPSAEWGEFKVMRAWAHIEARLKLNAQHVAFVLARHTPRDGILYISHNDLHELTGRAAETISAALTDAERAGLLHGKRTSGGFCYTWAQCAYESTHVGQGSEKIRFESIQVADENAPTEVELDSISVGAYRVAWEDRYGFGVVDVDISAEGLARIRQRIGAIAAKRRRTDETFVGAYTRTARDFMRAWVAKDGNNGSKWLAERYHPLAFLAFAPGDNRNAELDYAANALWRMDTRAAKVAAERAKESATVETHVVGPRARTVGGIDFTKLAPKNVQRDLGVAP